MKYVGAHVSAAGGVHNAPIAASEIKAKAFAIFTKNQKQWSAKPLSEEEINLFKKNIAEYGFKSEHILPHDSYLINLGNFDTEKREKALAAFIDEIKRAGQLGLKYLNFHPGSHLNQVTEEECLDLVAESVNIANSKTKEYNVVLVVENTAGQGSNVGYKFEHIQRIINNVEDKKRIGVCIDTCHTFSAGYDISTPEKFDGVIAEFDKIVGVKYICALHLNDSKKEKGSKVDRHASIGEGTLGVEPFRYIMNQKIFDNIPLILETPDPSLWEKEIKLLYSMT
ncbi:MAG: deoxyribonuclease IV [Spirochaetaceae bacterium]|nr:deoxyribonuclease IV [Spirochaetaceae bacterium]